ncbi:putative ribonuclease H-like domain-containing protein [Tanacetum coccineum]
MKPFGCPVTILNTRDHLGKFDRKADNGFFVGYSVVSKAMRVFNKRTRIVEETLNIRFLENAPNVIGNGPYWLFDVNSLTISMNYVLVFVGNQTNGIVGTRDNIVTGQAKKKTKPEQEYIIIPICTTDPLISQGPKDSEEDARVKPTELDKSEALDKDGKDDQDIGSEFERLLQLEKQANSTNSFNTVGTPVSAAVLLRHHLILFSLFKNAFTHPLVLNISSMDNTVIFENAYDDEDVEEEIDMNNVISSYSVPDTSFTKFHKDHPEDQVIGSLKTPVQTRHMTKINEEHGLISSVYKLRRTNHKDFQNCLFTCFLSQMEPKKLVQALKDPSWAIGTKWVFRNKKDERGIVVKNKARLVAHGHTQEEGIDYDEVFAPVARIEAIRLFLAYASFKVFVVDQMDVKNAFLYGKIEEKVEKALYGLHQAPRAWYETLSTYLLDNGFHRGQIDKTLFIKRHKDDILLVQVKQKSDRIFISQDKYVAEILKKFDFASVKTASTPIETNKALIKDEEVEDVDVHLYRSMIGSLMYLTASRPDIMFVVCACARFQVTPKTSHFNAMKRIFRYLKGQPKLGLWYPRDSPFDLEAFFDSDYAGASLDRKSTIGGCQFLGKRLISWQCKKQTIVANSTTEAEHVAAANCYGLVLWIQNLMLAYGFNFMNTKIYIDNESTICIVKNTMPYSKTKHIEIKHHFIKDSYEKKLIQVIKIHTDQNVADLLIKAFDASRTLRYLSLVVPLKKVGDEAVHKELSDRMERAATTASSLEAEQDSGSGSRCQDTIWRGVDAQTRTLINLLFIKMANLDFCDKHNMVAYLQKSKGSEGFHHIIVFLTTSHIKYALTENPTIYVSLIHQFWETAFASTSDNGEMEITATIDGRIKTVTEASIRRHLKLEDSDGIPTLPNAEIFEQLALMGYASDSDKLTFQKGYFSPYWRFLIHTILHCLSPKKTAWEQFSSNIATAIICLATNRTFNFSKMIFDGMMKNLDSNTKFLMYPRFIQIFLNKHKRHLLPHKRTYVAPTLTQKLFSNMRRVSKGYTGIQEDAKTRGRTSADTEILLDQEEPTKLEDPGSGEKGEKEISTANILVSTAGFSTTEAILSTVIPEVKKDKEATRTRKLRHEEAIRLQEQINEEERQRIARDAEIAKQLQEEIDIPRQEQEKYDLAQALELQNELDKRKEAKVRKNMCMYLKNQGGYKQSHFKGMSYEDIRPIFERVWDQNQSFVPKVYEIQKEVMKRSGFEFQKPPAKRPKIGEVSRSIEEQSIGKEKEVLEEELKKLLVIVPVEEVYIEALQVKYPIIDWEVFTEESKSYWRIIRVGNHTEVYQVFEDMLKRFDRDDLEKLWDLVKKKFSLTEPTIDK